MKPPNKPLPREKPPTPFQIAKAAARRAEGAKAASGPQIGPQASMDAKSKVAVARKALADLEAKPKKPRKATAKRKPKRKPKAKGPAR